MQKLLGCVSAMFVAGLVLASAYAQEEAPTRHAQCLQLIEAARAILKRELDRYERDEPEDRAMTGCELRTRDYEVQKEFAELSKKELEICPRWFVEKKYPRGMSSILEKLEEARRIAEQRCARK